MIEQWHRYHNQQPASSSIKRERPTACNSKNNETPTARNQQRRPATQATRHQSERKAPQEAKTTTCDLLEDWPRRASSCTPLTMQDWQTLQLQCNEKKKNQRSSKKNAKVVTFSAMSDMFTYPPDDINYRRNEKAYSKADRKAFHSEACGEAMGIRRTILNNSSSATHHQPSDALANISSRSSSMEDESLLHLLKNNILCIEEMIGIEQMIFSSSSSTSDNNNNGSNNRTTTWSILKERREHVRAILAEQRRLRKEAKGNNDMMRPWHNGIWQQRRQNNEDEDLEMIIMNKLGEYAAARSAKSVQKARFRAAVAA